MAKQRDKTPKPKADDAPAGWPMWARVVVSLVVVWHVAVVFISPLSVPPSSELVRRVAQSPWVRWYSDPLYINQGYHFFGPDPPMGGQHVRYAVYGDDGRVVAEGEFPNLDQQWPRLWYHRHMMLADQMGGVSVYGDTARDEELMLRAYARHLLRKHDGAQARLESVFHVSLHPPDVRAGADPFDPQYYQQGRAVVETRADLDLPLLPPAPSQNLPAAAEEVNLGVGR